MDAPDPPSSRARALPSIGLVHLHLAAAALVVALLAACGGSDDDAAGDTTLPSPISCTSDAGIKFVTGLESCAEAFARGGGFATELGLATGPETPAADAAVAMTCSHIQGAQAVTLESPEIASLAEQLHSSGVCTGDLTMLVPTTTTPAVVLVESTGWTLVDVVDGDTLDVVSPEGAQLRVQLIGINAPEPGACMSEQATNALRFMAGGKELRLVPDISDADAEAQKLRYVEQLDGVDLGATMLDLGLAVAEPVEPDIARGGHYAQQMLNAQTAAAGMWAPNACPPATTVPATVHYSNCDEVRAAGAAPIHAGEPGYSTDLDADGDGIACDVEAG